MYALVFPLTIKLFLISLQVDSNPGAHPPVFLCVYNEMEKQMMCSACK